MLFLTRHCMSSMLSLLICGLVPLPPICYSLPVANVVFDKFVSTNGKFSIEYPLSWTVRERSRFDEPNTVNLSIYNAQDEFTLPRLDISYYQFNSSLNPLDWRSLHTLVNSIFEDRPQQGNPSLHPTIRVIEPINLTKYVVDGEPAGSYIYGIRYNTSGLNAGEQTVILNAGEQTVTTIHNNTAYTLIFNSLADEFDSPVTTQIREHMINSIRWIP